MAARLQCVRARPLLLTVLDSALVTRPALEKLAGAGAVGSVERGAVLGVVASIW